MFRSKKLSLLMALVFAFTVIMPVGAAFAATGLSAYTVPTVDDDTWDELGTVIIEAPIGAVENGDTVILTLPSGFDFIDDDTNAPSVTDDTYTFTGVGDSDNDGDLDGKLIISAPVNVDGNTNALYNAGGAAANEFTAELLDDNQVKIEIQNYTVENGADAVYLKVELKEAYIDDGFSGDIELDADAPSGSGLPTGTVVVGTTGEGNVEVTVEDDSTANDNFSTILRFKESLKGDVDKDEDDAIKLTLPDGFEWNYANGDTIAADEIWGDTGITFTVTNDVDEELELKIDAETTDASCFELTLNFEVVDETDAEYGDVVVEVGGASDIAPDEVVVGKYGDFGATIEADDADVTAVAGFDAQEVSDITITELLQDSLVNGRTITLTLPENAAWDTFDNKDIEDIADGAEIVSDSGVALDFAGLIGDDDETLKLKVDTAGSSDEAELTLEDIEVALEAGATGDLVVEVSGSAGLEGEITIAEVVAPITASAETTTVKIGLMDQAAGDIVITETKAGAIEESETLTVTLPDDVEFDGTPDVEVTEGDLTIDDYEIDDNDDNVLKIDIDNDSDEASTITISGIKYVIDRTLPEGDIDVEIGGPAVVETHATGPDWDGGADVDEDEIFFEDSDVAVTVVNAVCGTPAPGEQKLTTSVQLGENGSYISDGRIMVQLRDAATALGVSEQNLFWDNATKTATFIKGDRAVQITVGKSQVIMNGTPLPTDKGAEIKDGRTYVSLRAAGVAFGATTAWDNTTKTATLTVQ